MQRIAETNDSTETHPEAALPPFPLLYGGLVEVGAHVLKVTWLNEALLVNARRSESHQQAAPVEFVFNSSPKRARAQGFNLIHISP